VLGGAFRGNNEQGIPAKHQRDCRFCNLGTLAALITRIGCSTASTGTMVNGGYLQSLPHAMVLEDCQLHGDSIARQVSPTQLLTAIIGRRSMNLRPP